MAKIHEKYSHQSEPEIWHKDEDKEFIRWKEEDDGKFQ
jgi:hypothetical protein